MSCDYCKGLKEASILEQKCANCGEKFIFKSESKGHWTKDPPTEPGLYFWWNTRGEKPFIAIADVEWDALEKYLEFHDVYEFVPVIDIELWYSESIQLPEEPSSLSSE